MAINVSIPTIMLAALIAAVSLAALDGPAVIISCLLGWTMLGIAVSDAAQLIVPDVLSLPAIPAGLAATAVLNGGPYAHMLVLHHLGAAAMAATSLYLIAAFYRAQRGHDGLGLGDVKLAALAGAWTGWQGVTTVLLLACLAAMCFAIGRAIIKGQPVSRGTVIPFGAFLAPSVWLVWSMIQLELLPGVM